MVDYVRLQATAVRLIAANGGDFTFRSFDPSDGDAAKPWDGPTDPRAGAATTSVQRGIVIQPAAAVQMGLVTSVEDLLKRSQRLLLVAGGATDLTTFEEVDTPDGPSKIVRVHRLQPDGVTTLAWFVELER